MKERLKSSGIHHFLISPRNSEEMGETRLLTFLPLYYCPASQPEPLSPLFSSAFSACGVDHHNIEV